MDSQLSYFLRLSSIIEAMPDALVIIDKSGHIILINSQTEHLFGYTRAELLGEYVESLMPERYRSKHVHHRDNYFLRPTVRSMGAALELFGMKKDGTEFPVDISISPLKTDEGIFTLAALRDISKAVDAISEQKLLKEQLYSKNKELEKQNRLKTEFLANMSHDIRTPLTGVIGLSKLLEKMVQDSEQKKYAQWLGESGKQLLNMLNVILDTISGENIDEANLKEEPFELKQIIQEIYYLELPSTLTKGIELKTHIDTKIPPCFVSDHIKIRRILLNLLGNAIKFTQAGDIKIEVKLLNQEKKHSLLNFSVTDTGSGIPYELQDKVFDRFFRLAPSNQGTYTGRGLGLDIAQSYVNLLGGKILLTSTPEVGTTFYFDLLLKIGDIKQIPLANNETVSQSSTAKNERPANTLKLLLVEDNQIALLALEAVVNQAGFRYSTAVDGESALDLVKSEAFDLIITDLGLPGLSGVDLAKRIRKFEKMHDRRPVPIIGLTGHSESKIKDKCIKAGMNDAITKPISPEILEKIKGTYLA
ncbi:Autoinducer 2 sensor kinase/phosphatase LuxQ [Legionella massiliensis]|uniref:histidine kinase n=1 Tax=Legionella massiliensis TaxID=1034943 RepID=A0A078KTI9_9GAMM|nr:ATP-binding protein [Legionella massiliensis]CDZ77795.1 Autoinducer 2 sensor kinase/phosphatase LuxQ [Legionella massiliensis]CEE13533.1 Autoinducer 2 sensor kinase/phosphatase LuxQ [Legionella massiliensis]